MPRNTNININRRIVMKKKLFVSGLLVLLLGLSASRAMACNCGKKADGNQASSCQSQCASGCGEQSACSDGSFQLAQGMTQDGNKAGELKPVEVGNNICPVSGQKVGEMGEVVKYEYNGKIYNLCCKMCAKDFKKDPEKYSKMAEEEVKQQNDHADHDKKPVEGQEHHDHNHH